MTPKELDYFKDLLEQTREELSADLSQLKEEAKPVSPDKGLGRLTRQEALLAQNIAKDAIEARERRLVAIAGALGRVKDGKYGICLECEEEIALQRLKASPEAVFCISCARARS